MKNLFFVAIAVLAIGITSCNSGLNEPVTPTNQLKFRKNGTPITPSNLPQAILDYLNTNYPNQTIVEAESYVENSMTYYEVELNNNMEFYFDSNGNVLAEGDSTDEYIDPSTLPQAVLNYISTNYPNLTIVTAEMEQDEYGNTVYEIKFDDGTEIYLDANGNPVSSGSHDDDDDDDDSTVVLPTAATQYLTTNYGSYTIGEAEIEDLFGDTTQMVYVVEIYQGNQELYIYFDATGNFVQEQSEIKKSNLPSAVTNTLSSQYGTYTVDKDAYQYTQANGDIWYGVELESTTQEMMLVLDSNGTVLYTIID